MDGFYDILILGGGAAGLTAAIFASRKKMKTGLVTINIGGQNLLTEHEENYPGYLESSGPKLMKIFEQQARRFGTEIIFGKAVGVEKIEKGFVVELANGEKYGCRALILAYGKMPRALGIPGEERFLGRGVSNTPNVDAPNYAGRSVAIVGGGNSALEAAETLSKIAKKVYLIHRRDAFRADEITVDKVKNIKNVEFVLNSVPAEIMGDKSVTGIAVQDVSTNEKRELNVDGVFVEIGYIVDTSFIRHLVNVNAAGEILINHSAETSCPGIFAAGDITDVPYKQTVISAGMGATAAISAYMYLMKLDGKPGVKLDWG